MSAAAVRRLARVAFIAFPPIPLPRQRLLQQVRAVEALEIGLGKRTPLAGGIIHYP
jgi:hypothetical protein